MPPSSVLEQLRSYYRDVFKYLLQNKWRQDFRIKPLILFFWSLYGIAISLWRIVASTQMTANDDTVGRDNRDTLIVALIFYILGLSGFIFYVYKLYLRKTRRGKDMLTYSWLVSRLRQRVAHFLSMRTRLLLALPFFFRSRSFFYGLVVLIPWKDPTLTMSVWLWALIFPGLYTYQAACYWQEKTMLRPLRC